MSMKNCKKIYLDSDVVVKLTDEGLNTLCYFFKYRSPSELKKFFGKNLNLKTKELRMPLGDLINIYGEDPFMEGFQPFDDDCIYLPEESLE